MRASNYEVAFKKKDEITLGPFATRHSYIIKLIARYKQKKIRTHRPYMTRVVM